MNSKRNYLLLILSSTMIFSGFVRKIDTGKKTKSTITEIVEDEGTFKEPLDLRLDVDLNTISHSTLLAKGYVDESKDFSHFGIKKIEPLFTGSLWNTLFLSDGYSAENVINNIRNASIFEMVDYDYSIQNQAIDIEGSSSGYNAQHQPYFKTLGIEDAWKYMDKNSPTNSEGKKITGAGGSKDVVVAVIDTGVDYNHIDLKNNIWTNSGEIPDNGIDDDGNGYIDDYYGWNTVADDGDPMDDSGHGTHCAGIIAAEKNNYGATGVAYNSKIMCVKCGNDGGFTSANIAQAIEYAYVNGADVISMSIAGTGLSIAVEEALEKANQSCLVVAAAGNDSMKNEPAYPGDLLYEPMYPACYPFVLGVMACDSDKNPAFFTNWDTFHDNQIEYEVYSCGVGVYSLFPGDQYATWNGTSMATPMTAGLAALIRSMFPEKDIYSSKFLMSQIVDNADGEYPGVMNALKAVSVPPKPNLKLYDYYAFDNPELSPKNNGDGVVNPGETIRIGVSLRNRGGVATNVNLKAFNDSVSSHPDPYFELLSNEMSLESIGTYSIREPEFILDDNGMKIDSKEGFVIKIADQCADNYQIVVRMNVSFSNGLDSSDNTSYTISGGSSYKDMVDLCFYVNSGMKLPSYIGEDTVFDNSKTYILQSNLIIGDNATVTFSHGTHIQIYTQDASYYDVIANSPKFIVNEGSTLNFIGTPDDYVVVKPSSKWEFEACVWFAENYGELNFQYADLTNLRTDSSRGLVARISSFDHCYLRTDYSRYVITNGMWDSQGFNFDSVSITNSYIVGIDIAHAFYLNADIFEGNYVDTIKSKPTEYPYPNLYRFSINKKFNKNIIIQDREFDLNYGSNGDYDPLCIDLNDVIEVNDNIFFNKYDENFIPLGKTLRIYVNGSTTSNWYNNKFYGLTNIFKEHVILDYYAGNGNVKVNLINNEDHLNQLIPFINDIKLKDSEGNVVTTVGKEEFTVEISFNRPMNIQENINVCFGSQRPFNDYTVAGEFVSSTLWRGKFKISSLIEGGKNWFSISGGYSEDSLFQMLDTGYRYSFEINYYSAESMNMNALAEEDGIHLSWMQDDYETIMGYNIYRSDDKNGNYVKINNRIIPNDVTTYIDNEAESGTSYWYTFTIVLTDLTESAPANKINCVALDTTEPRLYHTPVSFGYESTNLTISCNASDNCENLSAILHYRIVGEKEYKTITMAKSNNKYFATILGAYVSLKGIEYYITVSDGVNTVSKGTSENPYLISIKNALSTAKLGDVDGDDDVTTKDALMIMQAINGDLLLSDDQFKRADLNKDEVLSSVEALRILQYINGNVTSLEM